MNKKQSTPPKKRGATVAAVLCFVAAIAIAGTYTLGNSREARQKEEIARTEENAAKEKSNGDTEEKARQPTAWSFRIPAILAAPVREEP